MKPITINMIIDRIYRSVETGREFKICSADGEMYQRKNSNEDWKHLLINPVGASEVELKLMPNIPDESTPQGTKVRVRDDRNGGIWQIRKFICINTIDEKYPFIATGNIGSGSVSTWKYCEIVEEGE